MHKMIFLQRDNTHGVKSFIKRLSYSTRRTCQKRNVETDYIPCFISTDTDSCSRREGATSNRPKVSTLPSNVV